MGQRSGQDTGEWAVRWLRVAGLLLGLAWAGVGSPLSAAEEKTAPSVCMLDYEGQLPGEWPAGWQLYWGKMEDDLFSVTNYRAFGGKKSLVLNRSSGVMYGVAAKLPVFQPGKPLELSWIFLVEGPGDASQFAFEIRQGTMQAKALGVIAVSQRKVELVSADRKTGALLGRYQEGAWHRVVLQHLGTENKLLGWLQRRVGERWEQVGEMTVPSVEPAGMPLFLMLVTSPGHSGYSLYLDDCACRIGAASR